jgi:hypothetical protein
MLAVWDSTSRRNNGEVTSFSKCLHLLLQHDYAPPHQSYELRHGCPKIILDFSMVAEVKLQFPGLHAHLTSIFRFISMGIIESQTVDITVEP